MKCSLTLTPQSLVPTPSALEFLHAAVDKGLPMAKLHLAKLYSLGNLR